MSWLDRGVDEAMECSTIKSRVLRFVSGSTIGAERVLLRRLMSFLAAALFALLGLASSVGAIPSDYDGALFMYDEAVDVASDSTFETRGLLGPAVDLESVATAGAGFVSHSYDFFENAVAPSASPWDLGWSSRGLAIEEALGGNLPRSFPTIDRFANGTATSIKSIDLTASSYQSTSALTSRLSGYVDKVAGFNGATFSGTRITSGQITGRELVVAVQPGAATSAQQGVLSSVIQYGANNGVTVRVVAVP